EVMRGGKATFASDIWGLGVVVHELVFGVKPRWSEGVGGRILPPELGRPLTKDEGGVLETCRACTRFDPAHRIARAANVGVLLVAPRRTRRLRHLARLVRVRRPLVLAGALTVIAALAVGLQRGRHAPREMTASSPPAASPSPVIVPAGEPADWTEVSTVLVQVPKRITCTRLLPDKKTIRFVWGSPPRAEDIDTFTRERVLSPLVPAAYAEGCPDLSPDGERLLFQGHTADGRPFAFVSEHPDGRDAVPVVQTAEATMSSEPTWLSSGDAFSFDVDSTHAGVFSIPERGLTVIPEATSEPVATTFRNVVGDVVFISALAESGADEIVGFSWPSLREDMRLRTRGLSLDLASGGGSTLYLVQRETDLIVNLVELDRQARTLRRLGGVHDQIIRQPRLASSGLAFLSVRLGGRLVLRSADGASISIASEGKIFHAAHCGEGFVVQREHQGVSVVERVDRAGKVTEVISRDPRRSFPGCSPDGRTFFYLDRATQSVMRCDQGGCRSLPGPQTSYLAVSPDGERLALMRYERRGVGIWWMSSDGGPAHYVSGSETACTPGWASSRDLWVSRRRNGKPVWVEVDVESGRQTGRIQAGSRDCSDGRPDPATPVDRDIQVVYDETSQLRLLDHQFLRPN
ncbi:MAG TPA: hypothetical protein VKQ32_22845, partial [Polyangia bacterium]|nr:hypothetical protein [Polyangia bacterium]